MNNDTSPTPNQGGKLYVNLGNISEDILKDGRKQYENGLPDDGDISGLEQTQYGDTVVPQNQSLIYTFSTRRRSERTQIKMLVMMVMMMQKRRLTFRTEQVMG